MSRCSDAIQHHAAAAFTRAPASSPARPSRPTTTTPPRTSSPCGGEQNGTRWRLRCRVRRTVRCTTTPRPRSVRRRSPHRSERPPVAGERPGVRWEDRGTRRAGRPASLHPPVRPVRRPTLPRPGRCRCGRRTGPRLANGPGTRQALRAGVMAAGRAARADQQRHRRHLGRRPAPVPDPRQRLGRGPAQLVRRHRPFRGEPRRLRRLAGPRETPAKPPGGEGQGAGVSQRNAPARQRAPSSAQRRPVPQPPASAQAIDQVRKRAYGRLAGEDRRSSKGRSTPS